MICREGGRTGRNRPTDHWRFRGENVVLKYPSERIECTEYLLGLIKSHSRIFLYVSEAVWCVGRQGMPVSHDFRIKNSLIKQ